MKSTLMIPVLISIAAAVGVIVISLADSDLAQAATIGRQSTLANPLQRPRAKRSHHDHHQSMMHNHLSRKVFDRACAASKDTIDEIIACMTDNETLMKSVKREHAGDCYKEAFGQEFNQKEVVKHKELICNNRDKFEAMTACTYKKTGENMDAKEIEKLTEVLVDVGLCIINALDG